MAILPPELSPPDLLFDEAPGVARAAPCEDVEAAAELD